MLRVFTEPVAMVSIAALVAISAVSCADTEERSVPSEAGPTTSTPSIDATASGAPDREDPLPIPAESIFDSTPRGYSYEEIPALERRFESQMQQVFADPPPGLALHSVAARRVLKSDGIVAGSLLIISVDLEEASTTPSFQQGLLEGFDDVQEITIAGDAAFYAEDFTANGQDVVVLFHEGTVAVEVFGVSPRAAKTMAEAVAEAL